VSPRRPGFALCWLWLVAATAQAHEVRPGYLELRETDAGRYQALWKVPARGDYRLGLEVDLPGNCTGQANQGSLVGAAFVQRWQTSCSGGLTGQRIGIEGLSATMTDVLVRIEGLDGTIQTARLTPDAPSFEVTASPGSLDVAAVYFLLGVEHILLGVDHLLFVLGLMFLVRGWRSLILTVTAFTVAHSITLAAATLGLVHVPQAPVEAVIALSVVFVAAEILRGDRGVPGLATRYPWSVAFVFGLLHGLGFAGALAEVGLPQQNIPVALLFFNVGVEAGQLLFIAGVALLLALGARWSARSATGLAAGAWHAGRPIRVAVAYVIGPVAAFWLVQRVAGF